jgi:hypothetical protein
VGRGWRTRILGVPHRANYPPWAWASSWSAWRHEIRRRVFQAIKDRPSWITRKVSLCNRTITPLLQPTRTRLVCLPSRLYKERQGHPLVHTSYNTIRCKASYQTGRKLLRYQSGMNPYKSMSSRLPSSSAYAKALQSSSRVTPWRVAGPQTPTMPENLISDASKGLLVTRKRRVTFVASVMWTN